MTGFNYDEVSIALHDYNFDTEATINALLEGRQDQVGYKRYLLKSGVSLIEEIGGYMILNTCRKVPLKDFFGLLFSIPKQQRWYCYPGPGF